ncbi:MAG TPA: DUF58 domain-containing protein [Candidatus Binatia bacterium]|nr:DUF58 domain-containing protein [Candidatus Binatia bacterium]
MTPDPAAAVARYAHLGLHLAGGVGDRPGERRIPGRTDVTGIEPEAWTPYTPGDDLRHLDWNALGRLDTLLVRRFTAEREVVLHLLLDTSASMDACADDHKLATATELALALATIGVSSGYALRLTFLEDGGLGRRSARHRRRTGLIALATMLGDATAGGALDVGAALGDWAHRHRERGVVFILSDLLVEPASLEPGLAALHARGFAVHLLQVLGRSEWEPSAHAGGSFEDAESGAVHTVACTPTVLARYHELLEQHQMALAAVASRTGATHACLLTDTPVHAFVTGELARRGLVRPR